MNDRKLENRIKSAYENIAPDILDSVLSDCTEKKGRVIMFREEKKKTYFIKYISGIAAVLAVILFVTLGINAYHASHMVASKIILDVNPSIEIEVNKNEKVLDVKPLNDDAATVIGIMDFSGSSLEVTVNALIGSMLRNGYISDAANSILVTVDSNDTVAGQMLQSKLMSEINTILESSDISGAILGQTVIENNELYELSRQYGITVGKAELIRQIVTKNTLYTFGDLVPLTINELNLISESGNIKLESIDSIGKASATAYIGERAAKNAAFSHAGIDEPSVINVKCKLDWENGIMVYEVDFNADGYEYEYDINAKSGAIVKFEKERDDDPISSVMDTATGSAYIGGSAAKTAAFSHAGVDEKSVRNCTCELEYEQGITVYEIEFEADGYEYDYEISAVDGSVVKYGKKADADFIARGSETAQQSNSEYIGISAAKTAVFAYAGLSENEIKNFECELDYEDGTAVYEISFDSNGYEYDLSINAVTGAVLTYEKEID